MYVTWIGLVCYFERIHQKSGLLSLSLLTLWRNGLMISNLAKAEIIFPLLTNIQKKIINVQ